MGRKLPKKNKIADDDATFIPALSRSYMCIVPPFHRQECFELFKRVVKKLEELGVVFWADRGTLLGAVRHQGMMVFDDNNNLAVDEKYWDTLVKVVGPFFEKDLSLIAVANEKEKYMQISAFEHALKSDEGAAFETCCGPPTVNLLCYRREGRRLRPVKVVRDYRPVLNQSWVFPLVRGNYMSNTEEDDSIIIPLPCNQVKILDLQFPEWNQWWTLRPRLTWDANMTKTEAPYFQARYYPQWDDELFLESFANAHKIANEYKSQKQAEKQVGDSTVYLDSAKQMEITEITEDD